MDGRRGGLTERSTKRTYQADTGDTSEEEGEGDQVSYCEIDARRPLAVGRLRSGFRREGSGAALPRCSLDKGVEGIGGGGALDSLDCHPHLVPGIEIFPPRRAALHFLVRHPLGLHCNQGQPS